MAKSKAATSMAAIDEKWRIESDMRTLAEAAAIQADPKRLKAAQQLAKTKMMELAQVATKDAD